MVICIIHLMGIEPLEIIQIPSPRRLEIYSLARVWSKLGLQKYLEGLASYFVGLDLISLVSI